MCQSVMISTAMKPELMVESQQPKPSFNHSMNSKLACPKRHQTLACTNKSPASLGSGESRMQARKNHWNPGKKTAWVALKKRLAVCVCVCASFRLSLSVYLYLSVCLCVRASACERVRACTHAYTCVGREFVCIYVHVYMHKYLCTDADAHACIHNVYGYVCAYINVYEYMYTMCVCVLSAFSTLQSFSKCGTVQPILLAAASSEGSSPKAAAGPGLRPGWSLRLLPPGLNLMDPVSVRASLDF